jgi:hypothetical protein
MNDVPNLPEHDISAPQETSPQPVKRRAGLIVAIITLVAVLAGAAFFAGRLLNGSVSARPGAILLPGGGAVQSVQIQSEGAEELPKRSPEASGQLVKRDDNVLTIAQFQEGNAVVVVQEAGTGGSEGGLEIMGADGPQVEIVVTKDTQIYRDATFDDLKGSPPESGVIQQKVEESGLDETSSGNMLTVWGRKSGDRIIAEVILFSSPVIFSTGQ